MIKGFKVLGLNMEFQNGSICELGKVYTYNGHIDDIDDQYNYCNTLRDILALHNLDKCRVFECEVSGSVIHSTSLTSTTNQIRLTRELSKEEINRYIEDNLEELTNDKKCSVRRAVARHGYSLDKLIKDRNGAVRYEVAKQGYGLDVLVDDEDWTVRMVAVVIKNRNMEK